MSIRSTHVVRSAPMKPERPIDVQQAKPSQKGRFLRDSRREPALTSKPW